MTEGRGREIFRRVLIALIAVTVASFFVHSLMPPSVSQSESDGVARIISAIFPEGSALGELIARNVRKIAHFCEYGLLGIETAIYVFFFEKSKRRSVVLSFGSAHLVAFFDESLQIISGRGPSIADVWLDMLGYSTLFALSYLLLLCIKKIIFGEKQNG